MHSIFKKNKQTKVPNTNVFTVVVLTKWPEDTWHPIRYDDASTAATRPVSHACCELRINKKEMNVRAQHCKRGSVSPKRNSTLLIF